MEKLFEISKTQQKLLKIFAHGEEGFWLGYVLNYTAETVEIQHFTAFGKPDGTVAEKVSNIERIEFSDDYARSFSFLLQNHQELEKQTIDTLSKTGIGDWNVDILSQLIGKKKLVSIKINGANEMGFPKEVTDEFLVFHSIGKLGEDYGLVCYRIEDVDSIQVDAMSHRKAELLYRWRKADKKQMQD
jgi:hypothetical protein